MIALDRTAASVALLLSGEEPDGRLLDLDPPAWSGLVGSLVWEGCAALTYHRLRSWGLLDRLSGPEAERLANAAAGIAARDLLLSGELEHLLEQFERAGLLAVPLRGPVLGKMLHGSAGLRPAGDLDLLAPRNALPDLAAVLREAGYDSLDRWPGFALRYYYTLKFYRPYHGWLIVEPRWSLAYPPWVERVGMEDVLDRVRSVRFQERDVPALEVPDLLLHLCLHLLHHEPAAPLLWHYEIHRVAEGLSEDEAAGFAERTVAWGMGPMVGEALRRVRRRFPTSFPDDLLQMLEAADPPGREGRLMRIMASAPDVDGRESLATFLALRGPIVRLRYSLELLLPSVSFMRVQYGLRSTWSIPFAYLRRIAYFAWQAMRGALLFLRG